MHITSLLLQHALDPTMKRPCAINVLLMPLPACNTQYHEAGMLSIAGLPTAKFASGKAPAMVAYRFLRSRRRPGGRRWMDVPVAGRCLMQQTPCRPRIRRNMQLPTGRQACSLRIQIHCAVRHPVFNVAAGLGHHKCLAGSMRKQHGPQTKPKLKMAPADAMISSIGQSSVAGLVQVCPIAVPAAPSRGNSHPMPQHI